MEYDTTYHNPFRIKYEVKNVVKSNVKKDSELTCCLCNNTYISNEIGLLNCMTHPRYYNGFRDGKNFKVGHYDCCGASNNMNDIIHFEYIQPLGCHRIDHVSSYDEIKYMIERPFVCVPQELANNYPVIKKLKKQSLIIKDNQYIISINNKDDLNFDFTFLTSMGGEFCLDASVEYAEMLNKFNLGVCASDEYKKESTSEFYVYEDDEDYKILQDTQNKYNTISRSGDDFVPFYIIRTFDYVIDGEKKREFNPDKPCKFIN